MKSYTSIESLEHVLLEESYVTSVRAEPAAVSLTLEVVLTDRHPLYTTLRSGEQHCYQLGRIVFERPSRVVWSGIDETAPAINPDGSIDYGNIDTFEHLSGHYVLKGGFGDLEIDAASCRLDIADR